MSFAPSIPYQGCPFPPPGPLGRVPRLHRYYEQLRIPVALLLFTPSLLIRATVCARVFRSNLAVTRAARGLGCCRVPARSQTKATGTSQVPRRPLHARRAHRPRQVLLIARPTHYQDDAGHPQLFRLTRLNRTAHILAVYASRRRLPTCAQDSLPAGDHAGEDSHLRSHCEVLAIFRPPPPRLGLAWRTLVSC
jgi:hypothetical protein